DGGPDGSDTADYTGRTVDLVIDLDGVGDDGAPGENDTLTAIENVIGGSANDVITGDASSNLLDGAAGNDDLRAGGGADVLEGGPGIDVLSAGPGDDRLDGGLDADDLTGSSGVDTVDYGGRTANLTVDIDGVADDGAAGETDNVRTTVENIVGGSGIDTLTGSTVDNTLAGGAGADVLIGLAGNDTADYRDHTAAVVVNLDGLVGDGASGEGDRVAADIENLVGGGGSDTLTGNSLPNRLIGGADADTLNGGGGGDTLHGGLGADVFNGGSGSDTVTYSDSLGSVTADIDGVADDPGGDNVGLDVENLTGGPYADLLTGSPSGNILSGGAGNDTLNGGGGWDTLIGGAGNDQFNGGVGTDTVTYLDHAGPVSVDIDGVSDDGGAGESDNVKTDVEKLVGTAASDTLTGGAGNNTLEGGAGNDVLSGGAGNDTLIGGPGADMLAGGTGTADVASYAERTTTVTVTINGVANDGSAGEMDNVQTDVENVIGGSGADTLEGSTAVNILTGGAGNDILRGLAGNDVLNGLDGIDVLDGGPGSDVMHGNAGSDTVTYAARKANVIVSIDGVANDGEAGEGDNVTTTVEIVTTGSGNDTITGSGVSNILWGNAGNDTFYVDDNVADEVHGGTGTDSADRDPGLDSTFSIEIYL
ncbi:MAG TPA: calcium-binding protein, partial [Candidatus Limnocylindrales bacterium]|nr:calcium-binding protein [Candidatus Limnocylindrales bacterium]